jgi:putative oxidoreductase
VLLLLPATYILGALLSVGIMLGAILSHVAILGIVVQNDGGLLFSLACAVLASSLLILIIDRTKVRQQVEFILRKGSKS